MPEKDWEWHALRAEDKVKTLEHQLAAARDSDARLEAFDDIPGYGSGLDSSESEYSGSGYADRLSFDRNIERIETAQYRSGIYVAI